MIHAISINHLEGSTCKPGSGNTGEWAERFERYAQQAQDDFAMYEWLEKRGKLPPPHRIGDGTVRKWQMQGARA